MKSFNDFKQQINEVLKASDPIEKWISDFVHSTNPKFSGKSKAERIDMAKGAYYGAQKNEGAAVSQNSTAEVDMNESKEEHLVHVNDGSKYDDKPHPKDVEHIMVGVKQHGGEHAGASDKGVFFKFKSKENAHAFKAHVNKCPNRSCDADLSEAVEYKGIGTDVVDKKKVLNPLIPLTQKKKEVKDFKEGYDHGPIDRDAKVAVGHKAAVLAGSGLDSGKHGTVVGSSSSRTGDQWHIKTASGEMVKMHKHRVAKLKEETLDEAGKVYDPITKKMVARKPIKVQAGGGATRNGVPVETGPSKHKQKLAKEEVQIDEISKSTLMRYIPKASRDVGSHTYAGKEAGEWAAHYTRAGDWSAAEKQSKKSYADFKKANKRIAGIDTATKKLGTQKEETEQIDELSKGLVARYANKVAKTTQANYDKSKDKFQFSSGRQDGMKNAVKRLTKEEVELDEAIAKKLPVQHAVDAVHATLGPKSATRFLSHLKPGTEKHTSWDKVNSALVKQGVQTHHIASIAQKTSHMNEEVNESRGHKTLATFFKNREVAQRAYQGNPAKDAEVAQGGGTPADQGIAAAKKDAKKLEEDQYTSEYKIKYYVDPITGESKTRKIRPHRVDFKNSKMRGEPAQDDDQGDVGMKEAVHFKKSHRSVDSKSPTQLKPDAATTHYHVVDRRGGVIGKYNDRAKAEASKNKHPGARVDAVIKEGFDDYHAIAKELVKRHGKNVDTGHISDIEGERDSHRPLDRSEVMHHVNKVLGSKQVKEAEVHDDTWKEYKPSKQSIVKALKKIKGAK